MTTEPVAVLTGAAAENGFGTIEKTYAKQSFDIPTNNASEATMTVSLSTSKLATNPAVTGGFETIYAVNMIA